MEPKLFLNSTVGRTVGVREIKGNKFGIELELEGRNVALHDVATRGWQRHNDGSLRGEAIEYTTSGAKTFEETMKLVDDLFKKFKEHGVKFNDSIRTSTHVHLNFSDQPIKYVINFFALFTLLEEVLQYYSGEDRKGNLFCISTREAEGIVGVVARAVQNGDFSHFAGDRYKYAACNLSTLYKFGTIEIRTMRGATSASQVNAWVSILKDMYDFSLKMESPADLIKSLSFLGAEALMKQIFNPQNYKELMQYFPVIQTLHYSLMEGARIIQVFAYEFEEDFLAKVIVKEKPPLLPGTLPNKISAGRFIGQNYGIYLPDGNNWACFNFQGGGFWADGQLLEDAPFCHWDERAQRFVVDYPDGPPHICRWRRHHAIPDEGPPAQVRPLPRDPMFEPEIDDNDEEVGWEHDEEGDEE